MPLALRTSSTCSGMLKWSCGLCPPSGHFVRDTSAIILDKVALPRPDPITPIVPANVTTRPAVYSHVCSFSACLSLQECKPQEGRDFCLFRPLL